MLWTRRTRPVRTSRLPSMNALHWYGKCGPPCSVCTRAARRLPILHVSSTVRVLVSPQNGAAASEAPSSAASDVTGGDGEDVEEGFDGFQRRVSANPEQVRAARPGAARLAQRATLTWVCCWQVLRYCHTATSVPLWLSTTGRPKAIPPCARCGAARWFEFQVLPQLLLALDQNEDPTTSDPSASDALDWGTVAVYSCSASCGAPSGASSAYTEEFVWHQQV